MRKNQRTKRLNAILLFRSRYRGLDPSVDPYGEPQELETERVGSVCFANHVSTGQTDAGDITHERQPSEFCSLHAVHVQAWHRMQSLDGLSKCCEGNTNTMKRDSRIAGVPPIIHIIVPKQVICLRMVTVSWQNSWLRFLARCS